MESIDQGAVTSSLRGENPVVERGDQFASYVTPLVQQSPTADTSFHSLMEGRIDSPVETKYGPNAPFWITSMGQALSEFGVTRPSFENPSPGEDEYRRIQASLDRTRNFQERVERIIPSPVSHKEPMSTLLPCLLDPCPSGYHTLVEILSPIDDIPPHGVTPHKPGQTSNPIVSNPRFVSFPPKPSVARGQSSKQMVSVHCNVGGNP